MRLILKLIAAPFIVLLTVLVAVLLFLFSVSSFLLTAASVIMALLGVGLFFISYPVGGVIYLGIAFLLSPFGLQAVAGAVITGLNSLNLYLNVSMGNKLKHGGNAGAFSLWPVPNCLAGTMDKSGWLDTSYLKTNRYNCDRTAQVIRLC